MHKFLRWLFLSGLRPAILAFMLTFAAGSQAATTSLSNIPIYSATNVPANLMLALSVEYPTGTVAAYSNSVAYSPTGTFLGYFDNKKCYDYDFTNLWFTPVGVKNSDGSCSDGAIGGQHWSGNMLNWATMTSLDEFRQSLTGGNRGVDTTTTTTLLRAYLNSQASSGNFNYKCYGDIGYGYSSYSVVGDPTFGRTDPTYRGGCIVNFPQNGTPLGTYFTIQDYLGNAKNYNAQVQVCKPGMLESNCNTSYTSSKPEGLIQQNASKIRVGASAYTFRSGNGNPNGGIRALLRDNGPMQYNGNGAASDNPYKEWDAKTGQFFANPDSCSSPSSLPCTSDTTKTAPGGGDATQSGAINYLNQFGYPSSNINNSVQGYETYDTIADLYWATLAYFMQVGLDTSYTNGLNASNALDTHFPVLTGLGSGGRLNDPISYSCQSNAILTIGDAHTHLDTAVPGGVIPSPSGNGLQALQKNGTVPALDANFQTNIVGNFPLIENTNPVTSSLAAYRGIAATPDNSYGLGNTIYPGTNDYSTWYLAGLGYFAHVNDIRNDMPLSTDPKVPSTPAVLATQGKQTITNYAVDVLEPGSYDGSAGNPFYNPASNNNAGPDIYWLLAKYGGFNDVNNDGKPNNILTWHTNSSAGSNLIPDNYFPGNRPDLIQSGLQQIFSAVASTSAQSGAGPTVTPTRVLSPITANSLPYNSPAAGFPIYNVQYKPITWDGEVSSFVASTTTAVGSAVVAAPLSRNWSAQGQLENLTQTANGTLFGWNTGRRVITWNPTTGMGVPFRFLSLSPSEQTALNTSGLNGPSVLNFLRGDKSNEQTQFRGRMHILGDIVDSQAALVQGPASPSYTETYNPGYSTFKATLATRSPVVYVGGNDGMLHAFQADYSLPAAAPGNTVTGGGSELFAYVPSLLYQGPNGTPQVDGLAALANLNGVSTNSYSHHFYVDQTPQIADVDFTYIGNGLTAPATTASGSSWKTMLVGGLGKGGKGIYALDITTIPSAIDVSSSSDTTTGEPALASKVLWEFTASDMGYSYGRPLVVKTRKYGWVVAVTSGYNNPSGRGHLYILNAKTGALLEQLDTPATVTTGSGSTAVTVTEGSASNPMGLTQATGYTQNVADGTVDQIYAGDLLGNVWRFDLTQSAATPAVSYPAPTLFATLTDPSGNPQPITTAPRIELSVDSTGVGTLRYVFVGTGKFLDSSDLNNTQQQTFYALRDETGTTPATTGLPRVRSSLLVNSLTSTLALTDSSLGWYYDLPGSAGTGGGTERVVVNPDAAAGVSIVTWATTTPSNNPCSLQGNVYAVDFSTGQTVLQQSDGTPIPSLTTSSATTQVQVVQLPDGTYSILYGQTGLPPQTALIKQPSGGNLLNQVNWREILD